MGADANRETIERFYEAFGQCNGAAMTACYVADAHFRDPAFGDLRAKARAKALDQLEAFKRDETDSSI